ncbi:MAG: iron-sulfur cluster biosynthesis transcriptional regulator SufR [Cyanobacteria bacterium P01_H01_bin.119]
MTSLPHPSTKEDILRCLLRHGKATAQLLADELGVSAQAIRRHLKDLESEALIEHRSVQEGMGRPNHFYSLSRKGRDRFPAKYDDFAISLLDTLAATMGKDQMGDILRKQWERKAQEYRSQIDKAGSLEARVDALVNLRKQEGYMAEWHEVNQADFEPDDCDLKGDRLRYIITEYNCAISHIAETFPSVCGHELEMFAVALPDCDVKRTHWIVDGEHRCGYLIEAKI